MVFSLISIGSGLLLAIAGLAAGAQMLSDNGGDSCSNADNRRKEKTQPQPSRKCRHCGKLIVPDARSQAGVDACPHCGMVINEDNLA